MFLRNAVVRCIKYFAVCNVGKREPTPTLPKGGSREVGCWEDPPQPSPREGVVKLGVGRNPPQPSPREGVVKLGVGRGVLRFYSYALFMIVRNRTISGQKGQHLTAQGIALGRSSKQSTPCKGKSPIGAEMLLPFQGGHRTAHQPRALPWANGSLPLWGVGSAIADNHIWANGSLPLWGVGSAIADIHI